MKLEVIRKIEKKETIDIEFPYYYKHDLFSDVSNAVIYGKIKENLHSSIMVCERYDNQATEFELTIEERGAASLACYMEKEYSSNEREYLAAKSYMLEAIGNI